MKAWPAFNQPVTKTADPAFFGYAVGRVFTEPPQVLVAIVDPGRSLHQAGAQKPMPLDELEPAPARRSK